MRACAIPFTAVRFTGGLLHERLQVHCAALLPAAIRKCDETGRIDNFRNAARKLRGQAHGPHVGIYFNDSDVYKVLEGIAYTLQQEPDAALRARADEWLTLIADAQESDGYLDTFFTLARPADKWTDMEKHEDYCAGHFFEAAIALDQATGDRRALDVASRLADHMAHTLRDSGRHWVVGHQEPELALVKLHRATGDRRFLDFAAWLVEQRGHGHGRGGIWDKAGWGPSYCQDDRPARELERVTGHAVRAMYYYTGLADLSSATGDPAYVPALHRLWENVVGRNMYVTGGIGSSRANEGFLGDFVLPNAEAYCETCAGIGLVYWAQRMHGLTGDAAYIDTLERALYNNVLAGLSLDGTRFFYVNPLESAGAHHRQEWFECSCCPTSLARFLPSVGGYLYSADDEGLSVNLYASSKAELAVGGHTLRISQDTAYPWSGSVQVRIEGSPGSVLELRLRIPGWADSFALAVDGKPVEPRMSNGYVVLLRDWAGASEVRLEMPMSTRLVTADPRVAADAGMVAVQRGPVVYCAEETDNPGAFPSPALPADPVFVERHTGFPAGGAPSIEVLSRGTNARGLTLVPYFAWDNRAPGAMAVWLGRRAAPTARLYAYGGRTIG
jgi:uncharacterized protein